MEESQNINYPTNERAQMIGTMIDDEATLLERNLDLVEEIHWASLKSHVMFSMARGCMNSMEREIMRLMHGETADIETCMKNIGTIYFTFRNRENALNYAAGKRMAEFDELERRLLVCGKDVQL